MQIELRAIPENPSLVAAKLLMKDKFAEIAAKETYRAKSIKGNVYNWNTTNQFMQQDSRYFTEGVKGAKTKNFVYCILILDYHYSVTNHSCHPHN